MQELITKLGIQWQSLLFQAINFFILLFVLKKFVYNPIIKILDERRRKVEDSVTKAEQIDEDQKKTDKKRAHILAEGQKQVYQIREQAVIDAEKIRTQKVEETRQEIERLLAQARAQIREEKEQALSSVRAEAAGLVMTASEKVLRERLDEKHDKELVERSIKELVK